MPDSPSARSAAAATTRDPAGDRSRLIVELAGEGIWTLDDNGVTDFVNPRMAEMLRCTPDRIVGRSLFEFMDDEGHGIPARRIHAAWHGERREVRFRRADGTDLWAAVRVTELPGSADAPPGTLLVVSDATDRRHSRAERESLLAAERLARVRAEETERMLADVLARVTDGFVAFDRDFRYTYVNDRAGEMLGRPAAELVGRNYYEEFPEAVGTPFEQAYARAMRDQVPVVLEDYYAPWDRWFENRVFPSAGGLSIFFSEITERKRLERDLTRHAERLEVLHELDRAVLAARSPREVASTALEHLQRLAPTDYSAVVVFEGREAALLCSRGTVEVPERVLAAPELDPYRQTFAANQALDIDVATVAPTTAIIDAAREAGLRRVYAVPLITDTHEVMGFLSMASLDPEPLPESHRAMAYEVGVPLEIALRQARLREAVERHAQELEERVAARTAELEERNAELEAFSYTVSHDLRAPLRAIQGFSQAILEDQADRLDDEGREYAVRVVRAAARLDLLIQDLLAYSRLSRADLTLARVDMGAAVHDALVQLESDLQQRGASVEVTEPFGYVRAHRTTLVQVLANLVSNAAKFVAKGTTPVIRISAERRGAVLRCVVEDNGIGVAEEHRDRIFRVFERLHGIEAYPGTGIGLAIVRKGLERMGGRAGMEPGGDQGSRFWIELPAMEEPA